MRSQAPLPLLLYLSSINPKTKNSFSHIVFLTVACQTLKSRKWKTEKCNKLPTKHPLKMSATNLDREVLVNTEEWNYCPLVPRQIILACIRLNSQHVSTTWLVVIFAFSMTCDLLCRRRSSKIMSSTLTGMLFRKKINGQYTFSETWDQLRIIFEWIPFRRHSTCKTSEWLGHKKLSSHWSSDSIQTTLFPTSESWNEGKERQKNWPSKKPNKIESIWKDTNNQSKEKRSIIVASVLELERKEKR